MCIHWVGRHSRDVRSCLDNASMTFTSRRIRSITRDGRSWDRDIACVRTREDCKSYFGAMDLGEPSSRQPDCIMRGISRIVCTVNPPSLPCIIALAIALTCTSHSVCAGKRIVIDICILLVHIAVDVDHRQVWVILLMYDANKCCTITALAVALCSCEDTQANLE